MFINLSNEADWLEARKNYLTGSEAGSYCRVNKYNPVANLNLWEEKVGLREREDISGKPAVRFGKEAEAYLRNLFLLMNPQFDCRYDQFGLWVSDEHPFMAATLDGLLTDRETGDIWIYEGKTGTVRNSEDLKAWRDGDIPINYYCQECHQMICVPRAVGVITFALIRKEWDPEESHLFCIRIRRDEVMDDIEDVLLCATEMHEAIVSKTRPAVVLGL